MVESDLIDAVLILTPVGLHHEIALRALAAGKHVLIEKPLAVTVRAGRRIADEAEQRGLIAGVAECQRYEPPIRARRWALEHGAIGEPLLWVSGGVGGQWLVDQIVAGTAWRHRRLDAGGGLAVDAGVHLMHEVRYLMGAVAEVSALTSVMEPIRRDRDAGGRVVYEMVNEVNDLYLANLRFSSGALGNVIGGWSARGATVAIPRSPVIYGAKGSIHGDQLIEHGKAAINLLELLDEQASAEELQQFFPHQVRNSFGLELLDFCRAISGEKPMETSAREGVIDLACAYAMVESDAAARPVRVDDVLAGAEHTFQAGIDEHYGL
jgi:predicted dehydrogenase